MSDEEAQHNVTFDDEHEHHRQPPQSSSPRRRRKKRSNKPVASSATAKTIQVKSNVFYLNRKSRYDLRRDPQRRMEEIVLAIRDGADDKLTNLIGLDTALNQLLNACDSDGQMPLHNAARFNRAETVVTLIKLGAQINARNTVFDTPLHVACKYGSAETAAALIYFGAMVTARSRLNLTPLHAAAAHGTAECLRLMLIHGTNPFCKTSSESDYGNSPLHLAAWFGQPESIKTMLDPTLWSDSSIIEQLRERRNDHGNTPLHLAAINGQLEAARTLLDKGADLNAKGKNGRRPIHFAAVHGHAELVRLLHDYGAVIRSRSGPGAPDYLQTPIHLAAFYGKVNVIDVLLERDASLLNMPCHVYGQTTLHRAVANFQAKSVDALIKHGAELNALDDLNQTPLMLAKYTRAEIGTFRSAENRQLIIKLLSENGAVESPARNTDPGKRIECYVRPMLTQSSIARTSLPKLLSLRKEATVA